ncbi:MAG: peptide-methionine (S)-S-oxide reductase MsrA [Marinoscillum sp.]
MEKITLGSGCFWCTEAIFQRLAGVESAVSGYSGGKTKDPFYREVVSGKTGHAEVVQVTYDPDLISLEEILEVFWKTHDPTTLNRQGNDVGTQYRSAVFFHNSEQKETAERLKKALDESGAWGDPIVTEITPIDTFYPAEDYHQDYYNENGSQPYCQFIVAPKVKKFKEVFGDKMKNKSE